MTEICYEFCGGRKVIFLIDSEIFVNTTFIFSSDIENLDGLMCFIQTG